jgi:hypothetical protein
VPHRPDLARLLLALAFGAPGDELAALAASDWAEIDRLADMHRLRPWLAERWSDAALPIPTDLLERWHDSRRLAAIQALGQRADLVSAVKLLEAAGIASVALKGSWFAWYAYPAPALRPMHDIDLLVAPEHAVRAYELLQQAGFARTRAFEHGLEQTLAHDKHLPQLTSANGTVIELHMRCWPGPSPRPRDFIGRARQMTAGDPVLYPAADDLFAHVVIHAAVEGRFDCGALVLLDLEMLLRTETLDWARLLAEAEEEGWLRHAALLLALAERWPRPGLLERTGCKLRVPAAVLEHAERLIVQDLRTCREAVFLASIADAAASGGLLRMGVGKLLGGSATAGEAPGSPHQGSYAGWLSDRLRRHLAAPFRRSTRRQAAGYRTVLGWCGGADARG